MKLKMKFLRSAFSLERMIGIALLAGFIALRILDPYPIEFLRLKTFDWYQQLKPREIPPLQGKPVTIIDLDEESLEEIGQWPWPRTTIAKMTANLMQMGAALVAFDIVFAEPDRMNPNKIPDTVVGLDEATVAKLRALPSNDQVFADVVKKSRVVLGQAGYWEKLESTKGPPIKKSVAILKQGKNVNPEMFLPNFPTLIRNVGVFEKEAAGHGIFSLVPETDNIVRRVPTIFMHDGKFYPSLAIEMLRIAFQRKSVLLKANQAGVTYLGIHKKLQIPTDSRGRAWPYYSKSDKAKYVSAREVLNGTADPKLIKGKLTIVGTSAVGLLDIRTIPTEPVIPGVEVHVQMIESALHKAWLARPNYFNAAELALVLVGGLWKEFKLVSFDAEFAATQGLPVTLLEALMTVMIALAVVVGLQMVGVVLMAAMVIAPAVAARQWANRLESMVALSALFGILGGVVGGRLLSELLNRLPMPTGTYPVIAIIGALLIFSGTMLAGGSGFLAAYVAGIAVRNRVTGPLERIANFSEGFQWLSQILLFLMLGLLAMLIALSIGLPAGLIAALYKNSSTDYLAMSAAMIGICLPTFVMGPLLILGFSSGMGWFAPLGWYTWSDMVLPSLTLGLYFAAYIARLTRGGMLEVLSQDFIRTARAKGASERRVMLKHALKGGLLPVVAFIGPAFAGIISGSFQIFDGRTNGKNSIHLVFFHAFNLRKGI